MGKFSFLPLIVNLVWLAPAAIVLFSIARRFRRKKAAVMTENPNWYLQIFLSKEDAFGQIFFILSCAFFIVTLLAFDTQFALHWSWRTIALLSSLYALGCAYKFRAVVLLGIGLVGLVAFVEGQAFHWARDQNFQKTPFLAIPLFSALIFYAAGRIQWNEARRKRFGAVYLLLGTFWIFTAGFLFSFKPGLQILEELLQGRSFLSAPGVSLVLLVLSLGTFFALLQARRKQCFSKGELAALGILAAGVALLCFLPPLDLIEGSIVSYGRRQLTDAGVIAAVFFNLLIFFLVLGFIFSGYERKEEWPINVGAFLLFVLMILKYFDWFFTFLDKSLFFIGAGLFLFVIGWLLERGRRKIVTAIQAARPA